MERQIAINIVENPKCAKINKLEKKTHLHMLTPRVYSTSVAFGKRSRSIGCISCRPLAPKDLKMTHSDVASEKIFKYLGGLLKSHNIAFVTVSVPSNVP